MKFTKSVRILAIGVFLAAHLDAADVVRLTLTDAVHLAISQNRALKIARLKVAENEQKKAGEHSAYFPNITNQSNLLHVTDLQNIVIPVWSTRGGGRIAHPGAKCRSPAGPKDLLHQRHTDHPASHPTDSRPRRQPDCRRRDCRLPRRSARPLKTRSHFKCTRSTSGS